MSKGVSGVIPFCVSKAHTIASLIKRCSDTYWDKATLVPIYQKLVTDPRFVLIDKRENFEVYKKI